MLCHGGSLRVVLSANHQQVEVVKLKLDKDRKAILARKDTKAGEEKGKGKYKETDGTVSTA